MYLKVLPITNGWDNNFRAWCGLGAVKFGITHPLADDFFVASLVRDDVRDDYVFDPDSVQAEFYTVKSLADFDKDLIMWNGTWIRAPRSGAGSGS